MQYVSTWIPELSLHPRNFNRSVCSSRFRSPPSPPIRRSFERISSNFGPVPCRWMIFPFLGSHWRGGCYSCCPFGEHSSHERLLVGVSAPGYVQPNASWKLSCITHHQQNKRWNNKNSKLGKNSKQHRQFFIEIMRAKKPSAAIILVRKLSLIRHNMTRYHLFFLTSHFLEAMALPDEVFKQRPVML